MQNLFLTWKSVLEMCQREDKFHHFRKKQKKSFVQKINGEWKERESKNGSHDF